MPKDPEQICTSSDGNNKTAIAGFAMPESEHPSLSGIDLSQLSEEELIDAIASAHEEELALESNDKGDAESSFENETEAEEDIDPFPREEVAALESWCPAWFRLHAMPGGMPHWRTFPRKRHAAHQH